MRVLLAEKDELIKSLGAIDVEQRALVEQMKNSEAEVRDQMERFRGQAEAMERELRDKVAGLEEEARLRDGVIARLESEKEVLEAEVINLEKAQDVLQAREERTALRFALQMRIRMAREFREGKHEAWDLEGWEQEFQTQFTPSEVLEGSGGEEEVTSAGMTVLPPTDDAQEGTAENQDEPDPEASPPAT